MWWHRNTLFLVMAGCLCLAVLAAGCGYSIGSSAPVVLPMGHRSLAVNKVDNPTTEIWLEPLLRSKLRDELGGRGVAVWTDSSKAESLLNVRIIRLTRGAAVKDKRDKTLKYEVEIRLEGKLINGKDRTPLWQSGPIMVSESYYSEGDRSAAEDLAVTMAVRELADRMGQAY
jgi:hypothetical protein